MNKNSTSPAHVAFGVTPTRTDDTFESVLRSGDPVDNSVPGSPPPDCGTAGTPPCPIMPPAELLESRRGGGDATTRPSGALRVAALAATARELIHWSSLLRIAVAILAALVATFLGGSAGTATPPTNS